MNTLDRQAAHACRACRRPGGQLVLDLGEQPACDYFPPRDDPGPDPVYPLQMWLCASCGLAQLLGDPTMPEEPRGTEPAALAEQAADAVARVCAAGWLPAGTEVAEYPSPHGGSWLGLLAARGLRPAAGDGPAGAVLDCFGLMHAADQRAALAARAARVAPGGVLLLQYHELAAILRGRQWTALRHGHYAYYSTTALTAMLAAAGFTARAAWTFGLYGGTTLLAATRDGGPDGTMAARLAADAQARAGDPGAFGGLQRHVREQAGALRAWLAAERSAGHRVLGYGAASRAVALLALAGIDRGLLPAVIDASAAKQGRRMPGTDVPVTGPGLLAAPRPDAVLVFVPDLMAEVRRAYPEVERAGGRWVDAGQVGSGALQQDP